MTSSATKYTTYRELLCVLGIAALCCACGSTFVHRPDTELRPAPNWFGTAEDFDYVVAVHKILLGDAPRFRESQFLSTTTRYREQVVFVDASRWDENTFRVVHVVASESIRLAYAEERLDRVKIERHEANIESASAKLLSRIWFCAAAQSRYDPVRVGVPHTVTLDGEWYEFGTSIQGVGWAAASTVSPEPETVAGRLVSLGQMLIRLADAPSAERSIHERVLRTHAESLWSDLLARTPDSEICQNLI